MDIDPRQIPSAAQAGVKLLGLGSTLIPGDIKAQVVVLESVLMGIATGGLMVVPVPEDVVKSDTDSDNSGDKGRDDGDDKTDAGGDKETPRGRGKSES